MMATYLLRRAQTGEFPQILALLQVSAQQLQAKGLSQWHYWLDPPAEKVTWIKTGFDHGEFFLLLEGSQTLGMVRLQDADLTYWGVQPQAAVYIHSLVVHPNWAGQQLGRKMLVAIAHHSFARGINRLRLDCDAQNRQLCAYYENLGFSCVGQVEQPFSTNNLYEKILSPQFPVGETAEWHHLALTLEA